MDGETGGEGAALHTAATAIISYPSPLERRQRLEAAAAAAARRRHRQRQPSSPSSTTLIATALSFLAACACAAALELARRRSSSQKQQQLDRRRKRPPSLAAAPSPLRPLRDNNHPPNLPPELAAAVPANTLRPLTALLETVYTLRGWRGGGYHYERAWERALQQAQRPENGGWEKQFDARQPGAVTRATLRALARCLDAEFFGGRLHGLLMRRLFEEGHDEDEDREGEKKQKRKKVGPKAAERAAARAAAGVLAAAAAAEAGSIGEDDDEDDPSSENDDAVDRAKRKLEQAEIAEMLGLPGARKQQQQQQRQQQRRERRGGRQRGRRRSKQPWRHEHTLTYTADPLHWPPMGYVAAYSSDEHTVRVSTRAWAAKLGLVTAERPLNCEGWRVDSLLAALAHSLAHELVHALIAACFPRMELEDLSYLGEDGTRHGPAFALLNRAIFGHTSPDALEWAPGKR